MGLLHRRRPRGWPRPYAHHGADSITRLRPGRGASLHLGCGDVYMHGYLNVDYPPASGVASGSSRPDLEADILELDCPPNTLREIRLHHVFEHFDRAIALAQLVRWFEWLEPGGALVIETPDFERCVERFGDRSFADQAVILRHVFGSQEASWAVHRHGWSAKIFMNVLPAMGFERVRTETTVSDERGLLVNVVARAIKTEALLSREERMQAATTMLRLSMNGENATEEQLFRRWVVDLHSSAKLEQR